MTSIPRHLGAIPTALFVVLLLSGWLTMPIEAMVYTGQIKSEQVLFYVTRFGFQSGGVAKVELSDFGTARSYGVIGCTNEQALKLDLLSFNDICSNLTAAITPCSVTFVPTNEVKNRDFPVSTNSFMSFYILNCGGNTTDVNYRLELRNRNGNHLSTSFIHMPTELVMMLIITLALGALVAINRCLNCREKSLLHLLICCYPVLKMIACITSLLYWQQLKNQGFASFGLSAFYNFTFVAEQISLFSVITLAAYGFGMAVPLVEQERWPILLIGVISIFTFAMGSFASSWFRIFAVLSWLTVLALAIRSVSFHHKRLRAAAMKIESDRALKELIELFRTFKFSSISFGVASFSLLLLDVVALSRHQWLLQLLTDLLQASFFAYFAYIFRLRSGPAFYKSSPSVANLDIHYFDTIAMSLAEDLEMDNVSLDEDKASDQDNFEEDDQQEGMDDVEASSSKRAAFWESEHMAHRKPHANGLSDRMDEEE